MGSLVSPDRQVERTVDARGLLCPLPILALAKALRALPVGSTVALLSTDPAVEPDVRAFCEATGFSLVGVESEGTVQRSYVRKVGR